MYMSGYEHMCVQVFVKSLLESDLKYLSQEFSLYLIF